MPVDVSLSTDGATAPRWMGRSAHDVALASDSATRAFGTRWIDISARGDMQAIATVIRPARLQRLRRTPLQTLTILLAAAAAATLATTRSLVGLIAACVVAIWVYIKRL